MVRQTIEGEIMIDASSKIRCVREKKNSCNIEIIKKRKIER